MNIFDILFLWLKVAYGSNCFDSVFLYYPAVIGQFSLKSIHCLKDILMNNTLILMLLVANLANTKIMQKSWKITKTLANGYSSGSIHRELSNEYQHDRVYLFFKNLCVHVLWTKVSSALEGFSLYTSLPIRM